jgi:cholesterol transport system auxiliary component
MIVAVALLSCVGTKGPPLESKIYSIEYPAPGPVTQAPLQCSLRVEAFDVHPSFSTDRIAYREEAFLMNTYRYHRWQAPPPLLVAWLLERDLQSAAVCRSVIGSDSLMPATHVLEGTVDEFFENDTENGWQAVLTLSLTLATTHSGESGPRILLQRRYSVRKPCRYKNPHAVAEAMSLAMAEVSENALKDIARTLSENP